ncbi:hypothetical protein NP493_1980g00015 [Ridgeia piscesae]|uniref:Endonuclease-reverse transcriptase n=1 Tax=Ridgeia piscesae TaxID=27915 RepID=A0AAD9N6V3_RIDPI|nr:hypothetical protein NP493_1980g00015 [Ridgeia piscesae]
MTNNTNGISTDIRVNGEKLDCVNWFEYLGAIIADEESKPEILARITQATAALAKLKTIWNDMNIPLSSKIRLVRSLVMSIFLYACGSWTLTADTERRIQAMEMRCLRKLLGITYRDHISNEEVRSHWAPRRTLDHSKATQTEMVRASNKMYRACQDNPAGHSARREKKRQTKKRWEDNIPELTGMTLGAAMRKPERREEWRELVARSSVAPNGPPDYGIGEGEEVQHGSFTVNALR